MSKSPTRSWSLRPALPATTLRGNAHQTGTVTVAPGRTVHAPGPGASRLLQGLLAWSPSRQEREPPGVS